MKDEQIKARLVEHLGNVTEMHGGTYHSPEELLGFLTEEYHEFCDATHMGRSRYTGDMKAELLDIMVVCWKGLRACE